MYRTYHVKATHNHYRAIPKNLVQRGQKSTFPDPFKNIFFTFYESQAFQKCIDYRVRFKLDPSKLQQGHSISKTPNFQNSFSQKKLWIYSIFCVLMYIYQVSPHVKFQRCTPNGLRDMSVFVFNDASTRPRAQK